MGLVIATSALRATSHIQHALMEYLLIKLQQLLLLIPYVLCLIIGSYSSHVNPNDL